MPPSVVEMQNERWIEMSVAGHHFRLCLRVSRYTKVITHMHILSSDSVSCDSIFDDLAQEIQHMVTVYSMPVSFPHDLQYFASCFFPFSIISKVCCLKLNVSHGMLSVNLLQDTMLQKQCPCDTTLNYMNLLTDTQLIFAAIKRSGYRRVTIALS